jgi:hypothetical protein
MQARLRWHLHELFPGYVIPSRALRRERVFTELDERLAGHSGSYECSTPVASSAAVNGILLLAAGLARRIGG